MLPWQSGTLYWVGENHKRGKSTPIGRVFCACEAVDRIVVGRLGSKTAKSQSQSCQSPADSSHSGVRSHSAKLGFQKGSVALRSRPRGHVRQL